MDCDYEIIPSSGIKAGDWVKVYDDVVSLVVAVLPDTRSLVLAGCSSEGQITCFYWDTGRMSYTTRIRTPEIYISAVAHIQSDFHSSFLVALTPAGPILGVPPARDGYRPTHYFNLVTSQGANSHPDYYAPAGRFEVWASKAARDRGEAPLVSCSSKAPAS